MLSFVLKALKILLIKLDVNGFKSSAISRKICNLHTVKISLKSTQNLLFQSHSPHIAPDIRILNETTYEGQRVKL